MIRRRGLRRIKKTKKTFSSLSTKELYSYAYYLYTASKVDDESELCLEFYEAIYSLAIKLKKKKRFENVLELCIKNLEEEKFLKLIPYTAMASLIFPAILTVDPNYPIIGIAGAAMTFLPDKK